MDHLLSDPSALQSHVLHTLNEELNRQSIFPRGGLNQAVASGVLFLMGRFAVQDGKSMEICVVLNKRSMEVRQSGDLCCPGGMIEKERDPYLAKLLSLPFFPLARWPYWPAFRTDHPEEARWLSLIFATALRESWEEMRLNPFGIKFLGILPYQRLVLFDRIIHPVVGWIRCQNRFVPSWEVEKVVPIPLRDLLDPSRYAHYKLFIKPELAQSVARDIRDLPCFLHSQDDGVEILWGATYRIVVDFLNIVFGFKPPDLSGLPVVPGVMEEQYLMGRSI